MRLWLVVGLASRLALADVPRELERERTAVLEGRLSLRVARGMVVDGHGTGVLDWGGTRFTLEVRAIEGVTGGLHDLAARETGDRAMRIDALALAGPWLAVVVTAALPVRAGGRARVCAAYIAAGDGVVDVLEFFVDEDGFDDHRAWAALAKAIALTIVPARLVDHAPGPPRAAPLPRGWELFPIPPGQALASLHGQPASCEIRDGELDARAVAEPTATMLPGRLNGNDLYWSTWAARDGHHAETMTGAAHWGTLHVICVAKTARLLDELRAMVEQRYAEPTSGD